MKVYHSFNQEQEKSSNAGASSTHGYERY